MKTSHDVYALLFRFVWQPLQQPSVATGAIAAGQQNPAATKLCHAGRRAGDGRQSGVAVPLRQQTTAGAAAIVACGGAPAAANMFGIYRTQWPCVSTKASQVQLLQYACSRLRRAGGRRRHEVASGRGNGSMMKEVPAEMHC